MTKRLTIVPTILVFVAAALMISLGIWQLHRAKWKEAMLAEYGQAQNLPPIAWPTGVMRGDQLPLFRHATGVCLRILGHRAVAGENRAGEPGYSQILECATGSQGSSMNVEVGWSKNPNPQINWSGGPVSGIIGPDRLTGMRLVAGSAPPGLEPAAPPSILNIPNNHRSYAVQWFAFAAIAVVIYVLALRRRLGESAK
jgi:cytochrome oxidase assembly protein ShyY1